MTIDFQNKTTTQYPANKPVYRVANSTMIKTTWEDLLNEFYAAGYELVGTFSPASETAEDPGYNPVVILKLRDI